MKEFKAANPSLAEAMKTHLIDDLDSFGIFTNDYDAFIKQRAERVSTELRKRIIPREVDAHGQIARADDFEEEMASSE